MSIRLTEPEAWEMIEGAHTGILTTLKADGFPVTLPIWFAVVDHTICFRTPARTKKVARITRDPRASFLVESGELWAELRAVHLNGLLEPVDDEAEQALIDQSMDEKYAPYRPAAAQMPEATRAHYSDWRFLRFVPGSRILSWDNSRIPLQE